MAVRADHQGDDAVRRLFDAPAVLTGWRRGRRRRAGHHHPLDERDCVTDRDDPIGRVVGDLDSERLLDGHDDLDQIETIGAQIATEVRPRRHLPRLRAEVLRDDLLHAIGDAGHSASPSFQFQKP